jgi:glycosyltransferase involved in cell wall biosynthesis
MLSILIPERNYDCRDLVKTLASQCEAAQINFEIIVLDDDSSLLRESNREINQLKSCRFVELNEHYGAAKIRNTLAEMSKFPNLLIIDCDAGVPNELYIAHYLEHLGEADVIVGGLQYNSNKPAKNKRLRWKYGLKRECIQASIRNLQPYKSLLSFQFLIKKTVLLKHPFEETVKDYGHEDTLLGYEFEKNGVSILYIDNPLIHLGLDDNEIFIEKSLMATRKYVTNPVFQQPEIVAGIKLFRVYERAKKWGMQPLLKGWFNVFGNSVKRNLCGVNPSLFLFDLYRLGYLCHLSKTGSPV